MQSRKVEVTGYPVYECCNNHINVLRDKYARLEAEEKRLRDEIVERQERIQEIRENYMLLNKAEVNEVLEYVRSYASSGDINGTRIDILLCHCQNKLNGNLNSTFLTFDDPKEKKNESIDS